MTATKTENIDIVIPKAIHPLAKKFMTAVIDMLKNAELIDTVDSAALTMLAYNYSIFIDACEKLNQEELVVPSDRGNLLPNPLIKIAKDSQVAAMVILKEFGLTAKARTKLPQLTTETEDSPLDAFLKAQLGAKETR